MSNNNLPINLNNFIWAAAICVKHSFGEFYLVLIIKAHISSAAASFFFQVKVCSFKTKGTEPLIFFIV